MKYGLIKDKEPKEPKEGKEITLKDNEGFREA